MYFVFLLVQGFLAINKEFVVVDILRHLPLVGVLIVIFGFGYDDVGMTYLILFLILLFYRLFTGVMVMVIVEILDQNHIFVYNLIIYNINIITKFSVVWCVVGIINLRCSIPSKTLFFLLIRL